MTTIDVIVGIIGTIAGGVLGHLLSVRQQKIAWNREDQTEILHRRNAEQINFSVAVRFVSLQREDWLVELAAIIENNGTVRYSTSDFTFELRCLYPEDPLTPGGAEIGGQVYVPHVLAAGSWLPQDWSATLIEPGLTARYSYVTSVPRRATAVLLHGAFRYESAEDKNRHTAETLEAVPQH